MNDMSSLRTEYGGALGVLLLLYAMCIFYLHLPLPPELKIHIDNSEVVWRGASNLPSMCIKQQLVLYYDLWATTARLLEVIPCTIQWTQVKRHQTQGAGSQWKLDVELNKFCDQKAEVGRSTHQEGDIDPFSQTKNAA